MWTSLRKIPVEKSMISGLNLFLKVFVILNISINNELSEYKLRYHDTRLISSVTLFSRN